MAKKKKIILTALALLLLSLFVAVLLAKAWILEVRTLPIQLEVQSQLGFDTRNDLLHFGQIPPGMTASRHIHINNLEYGTAKVVLSSSGPAQPWLELSENRFTLKKGDSKEIKVYARIPPGAAEGNYDSTLTLTFLRF